MKLKVNRKHRYGKEIIIPGGKVKVDDDGVFEVKDEKHAKFLVENCGKSFSLVEKKTGKKDTKKDKEEEDEIQDELTNLSPEDLVMVAKESGIKGWQPLAKKPKSLKKFLRKKLKEKK